MIHAVTGGTDICPHDHPDRLSKGEEGGVHKTDDHDRRRGGGLHHGGYEKSRCHAGDAIGGHVAQNILEPAPRRLPQPLAHEAHAE